MMNGLARELMRVAASLENNWDEPYISTQNVRFLEKCVAESLCLVTAPKFSDATSAVPEMKNIFRVPCSYSFLEDFDEDGSEINLLTLKVDIPRYDAIGMVLFAKAKVMGQGPSGLVEYIKNDKRVEALVDKRIEEEQHNYLVDLFNAGVRELKEFRKDVVDGVRSAIGGKFPHADVDDAGGADYDSGNSVPFAVENKEGDKVDHMLLTPNPVCIEILGLANRGEIDKARSLINKLMRNLGVERA